MKKILAPLLAVLTTHILSAQVQKPATDTLTYLPGRIPARTVQEISYAPSGEVSQKVKTDFIASSEETAISNIELNKTKGVLDVSKTGSATWSFNFNLPPGIAGLVPELGLHYNSNAGNGVAGYGWNISGISEIARITSTRFHDNNVGSVNFNSGDRFALDGQRLILKSGTYGTDGAEYATEYYSTTRIISRGSMTFGNGSGPAYFEVFYPDGSKAVYGGDNGAAASPGGYSISTFENAQGARVNYNYTKQNNVLLISSVGYGSKGSAASINTVNFLYKAAGRKEQSFTAGVNTFRDVILSAITINGNGTPFRNYQLVHNILMTYHGYQKLSWIREFNGNVTEGLPAVSFSYDETQFITVANTINNLSLTGINNTNSHALTGDFTGNGKMDFILYPPAKNKFYVFWDPDGSTPYFNMGYEMNLSFQEILPVTWLTHSNKVLAGEGFALTNIIPGSGNGTYPPVTGPPPPPNQLKATVYSSGTVTPVYYQYERVWTDNLGLTAWHSYNTNSQYYERNVVNREWLSGDFNGDGLSDIIAISKPWTHRQLYQNGSYTYTTENVSRVEFVNMDRRVTTNFVTNSGNLDLPLSGAYLLKTGDYNGDGKTDILHVVNGTMYVYSFDENKTLIKLFQASDSRITTDFPALPGDYNGDGKMDIMFPVIGYNRYFATFYSTGKGFEKIEKHHPFDYSGSTWDSQTATMNSRFLVANDVDKDGKTDILELQTITKNGTTQGQMNLKTWYNSNIANTGTNLLFDGTGTAATFTGNMIHYPIPVFFNSDRPNFNLEFGVLSDNSFSLFTFQKDAQKETLLRSVEEEGLKYTIEYSPLVPQTNAPFLQLYISALDQTYPNIDVEIAPGLQVVKKIIKTFNGIETQKRYGYRAAVSNSEGLGFLGFTETIQTNWHQNDNDNNKIFNTQIQSPALRGATIKTFSSKGEYINPTVKNAPVDTDGSSLSDYLARADYTYSTTLQPDKVYINVPATIKNKNNLLGISASSSYTYDSYQNITVEEKSFGSAGSEVITSIFDNNPTAGYFGRLTGKTTTHSNTSDTYSQEIQITYTNFLPTQIRKRGNSTPFITEDLQYDVFGNLIQRTLTTASGSRTSSIEYDPSGRFITKLIAPDGKETSFTHNTSTGNILTKKDPDNKTTSYQYDSWGRWKEKTDFLGHKSFRSFTSAGGFTTIEETSAESMMKSTKYNGMGQIVEIKTKDVTGQITGQAFQYDAYGRKFKESQPAINGNYTQWNLSNFDIYGRLSQVDHYTGKTSNFTYAGLSTTMSDGTKSITTTKNALGQIVSMQDPGGIITYSHFANGNLKTTTLNGLTHILEQDGWGRKTKLTDPSAGVYTYSYNGFNELISETTPKGATEYTYDSYGKVLTRNIQGDNTDISYVYTYDPNTQMLTSLQFTNADGNNTMYTYVYDTHQRIINAVEDNLYARFSKTYTYTSTGRINTVANEAKHKATNTTITKTEKYLYTNGQLSSILDGATLQQLWKVNSMNARGQYTSTGNSALEFTKSFDQFGFPETFTTTQISNSAELMQLHYTYNVQQGNITSRTNDALSWIENFNYDNLDRLTDFNDNDGNQSQSYDNQGRISSISKLGDFTYSGNSYQASAINNLTPYAETYYQDRALQKIVYNAFKSPVSITESGKEIINFQYNSALNRAHMHYGGTETNPLLRRFHRHYSEDGGMEITQDALNSSISFIFYVGGNAYTAPLIWKIISAGGNQTDNLYYLHRDQLGSILLITDPTGAIKEKRQFDAWGKLVRLTDGTNPLPGFVILDRGFTGHEHLQGVQLIHMNRRLYDPVLHKFLAPDNYIQSPDNSQNFNRYAYALNNPLKYTDPSGDFFLGLSWVFGFIRGVTYGGILEGFREGGRRVINEIRIYGGLFATDPNKNFLQRLGELASRFTKQLPQTIGGFATSLAMNTLALKGRVLSVDYLYGTTVIRTNDFGWGGITQGSFIVGNNTIRADANNPLFQHEYGHYLQSQEYGWSYYFKVGLKSLFTNPDSHKFHAVEQDANRMAFLYFNRNIANFRDDKDLYNELPEDNRGWDYRYNPLLVDGWNRGGLDPNDPETLRKLNSLKLSFHWSDLMSSPNFFNQMGAFGLLETFKKIF